MRATLPPRQLEVYCEQVKTCIQIALECMKRERQERPAIQSIVSRLEQTEILMGNLERQTEQVRSHMRILAFPLLEEIKKMREKK